MTNVVVGCGRSLPETDWSWLVVYSGFANTDLDYQLHQREITHLIMAGMVATTCLESTARYAREL